MDLEGFSNKDKGIITRHPDASPYELLEYGLSQKGYDRLISMNEQEKVEKLKSDKEYTEAPQPKQEEETEKSSKVLGVTVEPVNVDLNPPKQKGGRSKVKLLAVLVRDKKTGREFKMSAYNAKFLDKKQFEILA